MSVQRVRRAYMRKEERREQILQAALRAFVRGGYHATHVSHVVAEAGVARGTFYLHFESKHEVFAALIERMLGIFIAAAPERPSEPYENLAAVHASAKDSYRSILSALHQHRRLCSLLLEEAVGLEKGFRDQLEAHMDAWRADVAISTRRLRDQGFARPDIDPELSADLIIGMVVRVTHKHLLHVERPNIEQLAGALADFELHGVGR